MFGSFQIINNLTLPVPQLEDGVEPDLPRLPDDALPPPNVILHDERRQEVRAAIV